MVLSTFDIYFSNFTIDMIREIVNKDTILKTNDLTRENIIFQ